MKRTGKKKKEKYCSMTVHIKKDLLLSQRFTIGFLNGQLV